MSEGGMDELLVFSDLSDSAKLTFMGQEIPAIIARLEAAMVEGMTNYPRGEFGECIVRIADLRRLITEVQTTSLQLPAPVPNPEAP